MRPALGGGFAPEQEKSSAQAENAGGDGESQNAEKGVGHTGILVQTEKKGEYPTPVSRHRVVSAILQTLL